MPPAGTSSAPAPLTAAQKKEALKQRRERRAELASLQCADVEFWKNEGNECFRKGQYEEAVEKYEEAIIIGGEKSILLSNLAAAELKLGRYNHARNSAEKAVRHDPKNLKARYRRALALKEFNKLPKALAEFKYISRQDSKLADVKQEISTLEKRTRHKEWERRYDPSYELSATESEDDDDDEDEDEDGYKRPPRDYFSDSDTSDCLHIGNGTPCRFYNKGTCNKGEQCPFSHAPDDKSVRDELGRNVCKYFLMHKCKYGPEKCVYSHTREFLPEDGWWETYEDEVGLMKSLYGEIGRDLVGTMDMPQEDPEVMAHELRVSSLGAAKRWVPYKELARSSLDMTFHKRRADIRKKVRDKAKEKGVTATSATSVPVSATGTTTPFVVVLSLEHEDFYNNIMSHLLSSLRGVMEVKQAFSRDTALLYLFQPGLKGVYIMDAGITHKRNAPVRQRLVEYVMNEGGRVCVGGMFPNNITGDKFYQFFNAWGLKWKSGGYFRTTFTLNPDHPLSNHKELLKSYSMKALHAAHVSPSAMVYRATDDSRLQSLVFAPVQIDNFDESPGVAAQVGEGWVGYVGDVNGEEGSSYTVMAILGLLKESDAQKVVKPEGGKTLLEPTGVKRKVKGERTEAADEGRPPAETVSLGFLRVVPDTPKVVKPEAGKTVLAPGGAKGNEKDAKAGEKGDVVRPPAETVSLGFLSVVPETEDDRPIPPPDTPKVAKPEVRKTVQAPAGTKGNQKGGQAGAKGESTKALDLVETVSLGVIGPILESQDDSPFLPPDSPFLLILAVSSDTWMVETSHEAHLEILRTKFRVEIAVGRHYALEYLKNPHLQGVYIVNSNLLTNEMNSNITGRVVSFVLRGGTAVVGGILSAIPKEDISTFFESFGLNWTAGQQRKAVWCLETRSEVGKWNPSLPDTFCVPSLPIIVDPKDAIYFAAPGYESDTFDSPVVRAKINKGYLGYVGYESPEDPKWAKFILAVFNKLDYTGPQEKPSRKFVVVHASDRVDQTNDTFSSLISALGNEVEVLQGLSSERVVDLLGSKDLVGVVVMTADIADIPQLYLVHQLVEYTKNGGTTIFTGSFSSEIPALEVKPFFEYQWGLPWDMESTTSSSPADMSVKLNTNNEFAKNNARDEQSHKLPVEMRFKPVCLTGVKEDMILYKNKHAVKKNEIAQAPIVVAPVGKGRVGYLGSAGSVDEILAKVVLVMLGL